MSNTLNIRNLITIPARNIGRLTKVDLKKRFPVKKLAEKMTELATPDVKTGLSGIQNNAGDQPVWAFDDFIDREEIEKAHATIIDYIDHIGDWTWEAPNGAQVLIHANKVKALVPAVVDVEGAMGSGNGRWLTSLYLEAADYTVDCPRSALEVPVFYFDDRAALSLAIQASNHDVTAESTSNVDNVLGLYAQKQDGAKTKGFEARVQRSGFLRGSAQKVAGFVIAAYRFRCADESMNPIDLFVSGKVKLFGPGSPDKEELRQFKTMPVNAENRQKFVNYLLNPKAGKGGGKTNNGKVMKGSDLKEFANDTAAASTALTQIFEPIVQGEGDFAAISDVTSNPTRLAALDLAWEGEFDGLKKGDVQAMRDQIASLKLKLAAKVETVNS